MKKKHSYIFEKKILERNIFCDPDAIDLLLEELKGKSLPEQLHSRGVRFVVVDNHEPDYARIDSLFTPEAKEFFADCRGFRAKDFSPSVNNFIIAYNLRKHRICKSKAIDWREMCRTLAHEVGHTWQMDARNCHRRKWKDLGHLSVTLNDAGDEDFCNDFSDAWLERGDNYIEAKKFLQSHRRHKDFSRIFPSHVETFTA